MLGDCRKFGHYGAFAAIHAADGHADAQRSLSGVYCESFSGGKLQFGIVLPALDQINSTTLQSRLAPLQKAKQGMFLA